MTKKRFWIWRCCGAIWRRREKRQHMCTTSPSCIQLLKFRAVFRLPIRNLTVAVSAIATCGNFFYIGAHLVSALNYCSRFFSNPSAIYTKWCPQTFPPIFGPFEISDRNFAKIVAPPSNEYANFWKSNHLWKKSLKTESKSAYKRQRNACSNYAPLERTVSK